MHRFLKMGTIDMRVDFRARAWAAGSRPPRKSPGWGRVGSTQMRLVNDEGIADRHRVGGLHRELTMTHDRAAGSAPWHCCWLQALSAQRAVTPAGHPRPTNWPMWRCSGVRRPASCTSPRSKWHATSSPAPAAGTRGAGTGFVWDSAGHIVTNFHVIQGGNAATVTLADQSVHRANLVGAFPRP